MDLDGGKIREEITRWLKGYGRLPLLIGFAFFCATTAWTLFDHAFLKGLGAAAGGLVWAAICAVVLSLLLRFEESRIRKSQAALKESEEYLSRLLETSASGILVMNRTGDISYANLEAASILGLARSDLVGSNYRDRPCEIVQADGSPCAEEDLPFTRVARSGEPLYNQEISVRRRDGSRLVLSMNAAPFFASGEDPEGILVSFFDITHRKAAEDLQLRKLHLAVEQSPSAIAITDAAGRIEYANPMFLRVTGFSEAELHGMTKPCPTNLCPHECRQIRDAIAGGREWKGEYWNRRRNGELFWESSALTPVRNPGGVITNFLWVAEDITEKRMAEEALRDSQERYRNMTEKIHDLVWEIDREMAFTYVSPRSVILLGYEPEELLGKTPFDLMAPPEAETLLERIGPVINDRLPFEHVEGTLLHRQGWPVVFTTSGVPYYGVDGSFRGWRGVSRDISRLKGGEEALRRSEDRFRQIFEQNEEAVILFRAGTAEILDANPAAVTLYGYALEEMREKGPNLFIGPGGQLRFFHEVRQIGPDRALDIEECRHVRKDGTTIIVSIRGKSIQLQDGPVSYCTFRDITARIRAEEEAKARQAQLIHANRMTSLGTMVSGVAHEINNPNNLIMFNAPLVKAVWTDSDRILERYNRENGDFFLGGLSYSEVRKVVPRLLAGISESSLRIRAIVNKLKDFARPDKEVLERGMSLNEAVRVSVSILNHEIIKGCRNFRVDLADDLPPVKGCPQQLEQVLVNLLMNALQALPDPTGGIELSTRVNRETGAAEVRIRDEGVGIPAEVMHRVTEPFFSTRFDSGGLGLGLSISAAIVRDHNGVLGFESEVGRGTTATLSLPVLDSKMEASPAVSVSKRAP